MPGSPLYPNVYRPIEIGPIRVKNRIFMTPHGVPQAPPKFVPMISDPTNPGLRIPGRGVKEYFVERARGGVGLIIQGSTEIGPGRFQLFDSGGVEAFRPIVAAVHEHGTKMFVQLNAGREAAIEFMAPYGAPRAHVVGREEPPWGYGGPSGIPGVEGDLTFPNEMTRDQIFQMIEAFAVSAEGARAAGYDGVELHACHSYLMEQWLSPFFNKRTDEYGGSLENRLRIVLESLEAMRGSAGPGMAIGIRINCNEMLPGGLEIEESREIARRLDTSRLVDFIDLDIGTYHRMGMLYAPHYEPALYEVPYIASVRQGIRNTVVLGCPGRFQDPADAERLIVEGVMDMVGGTRGFFADPEFAKKGEEGRARDIRPCIGLSSCHLEGSCVMNATNGRELEWGITKTTSAADQKRVVVVGGGPAGLEAARVAAIRGHDVVLYERAAVLGGALNLQAKLPTRTEVLRAAEWWARQLDVLGVRVKLSSEATAEAVIGEDSDTVIIATGARFDPTGTTGFTGEPIGGWDREFVSSVDRFLESDARPSGKVLVYEEDGMATAADVAWMLADQGAEVELVTRWPTVAFRYATPRSGHREFFMEKLYGLSVKLSPDTFLSEIGSNSATLLNVFTGATRVVHDIEGIVLVSMRTSINDLADSLSGKVPHLRVIGDASTPGRMAKATREGFEAAWDL